MIMNNLERKLLHNRNINFKGYLLKDDNYEIEAELIDTKNYDFKNHDRGLIKRNEPVHHMRINLIIDENMFVIKAKAITLKGPYSICKEANNSFKKIEGLQIKSGWKKEILKIIGGTSGCTHITELLSSLATAAFQTIYPYKSSKRGNKKISKKSTSISRPMLLGTCHSFNPKSEVVKRLWPDWYVKKN